LSDAAAWSRQPLSTNEARIHLADRLRPSGSGKAGISPSPAFGKGGSTPMAPGSAALPSSQLRQMRCLLPIHDRMPVIIAPENYTT
jgi:hypothetical protein